MWSYIILMLCVLYNVVAGLIQYTNGSYKLAMFSSFCFGVCLINFIRYVIDNN